MQDLYDEPALRRLQRQLNHEVEHTIRESNRDMIHAVIPVLDKDRLTALAETVARLRAGYLTLALRLTEPENAAGPSSGVLAELRASREAYDESRLAFEAVQRAVERGYLELS